MLAVTKAAELLDLVDTPKQDVVLTPEGTRFLAASIPERKQIFREQAKTLRIFHDVLALLERAAEGLAKATRGIGVAALTAGPGVTNGMSAIASAQSNNSPITVLGGRAPEMRWGSGSLQEIDHLPFVSPLVKSAETAKTALECASGWMMDQDDTK